MILAKYACANASNNSGRIMRKKVLALIIILCLALGALAAFAACDNTGKLDTPSGFTLNK